ncbi:hypothetical protein MC885_008490 [Smutsia gigantea]|nr:hypothetical protein MC885_008490 [Smutsia gigantea]
MLRNARKLPPRDILSHRVAFPRSPCTVQEQLESICLIEKPATGDPLSGLPVQSVHTGMQSNRKKSFIAEPEGEIVHVTLTRDPHGGFGGQMLALNYISLEGFTFDTAVRMIQNSPGNIELFLSRKLESLFCSQKHIITTGGWIFKPMQVFCIAFLVGWLAKRQWSGANR